MKDHLQNNSLQELISQEKRKLELSQLFDARARETLARINLEANSTIQVTRNSGTSDEYDQYMTNIVIEVLSAWDKLILNKYSPTNENDADYFPTTDSRVSKSKFCSSSEEDKLKLVDDQLQLIAALYFNNNSSLSYVIQHSTKFLSTDFLFQYQRDLFAVAGNFLLSTNCTTA